MDNNNYRISFFKPTSEHARKNRNMVVWFVSIWAIAIFGFQIALRVIEKPTPEPSFTLYENSWENIKSGDAVAQEYQDFAYASLSVLGKIFISADEKAALDRAFTYVTMQLADSAQKVQLQEEIISFIELTDSITDIADQQYLNAKSSLIEKIAPMLALDKLDVRKKYIPLELVNPVNIELSESDIKVIEAAMPKYLIHNQSFLTDTKFLGFPFHYFYTAIFLLVLFVGICWMYCKMTDKINAQLNLND